MFGLDVIKIENEGKSDGNDLEHEDSKRIKKSHGKDEDLSLEVKAESPEAKMNIDPKPTTKGKPNIPYKTRHLHRRRI